MSEPVVAKKFFEVFPALQLEQRIHKELETVSVCKVTSNSYRTFVNISIESDHLIDKKTLRYVEEEMKKQFFPNVLTTVFLVETFRLSSQYTPEHLWKMYRNSILFELGESSKIEKMILEKGKISFSKDNKMQIRVVNSIVSEDKKESILGFIKSVFRERFGVSMEISYGYIDEDKDDSLEEAKHEMMQEIKEITDAHIKAKSEESQKKTDQVKDKVEKAKKRRVNREKEETERNLFFGSSISGEVLSVSEIIHEMDDIVVRGKVVDYEDKQIKENLYIVNFTVTDFLDSIRVKLLLRGGTYEKVRDGLLPASSDDKNEAQASNVFIRIKGNAKEDKYEKDLVLTNIKGIKQIADFRIHRRDRNKKKRVELHCHTKMSDMDAVVDVGDLIARAHQFGHPAIAITDHGVVQAFPNALQAVKKIRKKNPDDPFKVIYGMEGYLVDDLLDIAVNPKDYTLQDSFVVFDIETTGFNQNKHKIIEIGAAKICNGEIVDGFSSFVNPQVPIPYNIEELTKITDRDVLDQPTIDEVLPKFLAFCEGSVLVAHNASFDIGFIQENCNRLGIEHEFSYVDTLVLSRLLLPQFAKYSLDRIAKHFGVRWEDHHRAKGDALATAEVFLHLKRMLEKKQIDTLEKLNIYGKRSPNRIKKEPFLYHVILLAQNEVGRVNLYKLVSMSHLEYFGRRPRISKSLLNEYREGIIVGSACEAGELYQALLEERPEEAIISIVKFYDYLEIQPIGNNMFMLDPSAKKKYDRVKSIEDLKDINRQIVELGEAFDKPVVATGDVHFLNPEDELYRRIIMVGNGYSDAENQPPLFLRTTQEMLDEFDYLGHKKAFQVVVEATNEIASRVESMEPVHPDKCPPVIPDSDIILRETCYEKAHSMYGNPLPAIVTERLERELSSIISNGFAVMYIIAQKLVSKSNEDGYLVGSRGSVGSSFVATMAGITEVNPLPPHYYCNHCQYSDFTSPEVLQFTGGCGWDMPEAICPQCQKPLAKDGFDIPFETFLGFEGDKEPDIDLNFSGEYQSRAHQETEVIFGKDNIFRAGTITSLAEKTTFGYVIKYFEGHGEYKKKCEIVRIVNQVSGVRKSTGQHPGGIIVLPHGRDINTFTPVQHPANDQETDVVTTHFDYHSIEHNLLKLDILGHDDPTMIKELEELINSPAMDNEFDGVEHVFKATEIPLDDAKVMSLFADTAVLGIEPKDLGGTPLGCLGIPEFGTDFVIQMVVDTKPKNLSDLIRISGLSHGTDVWVNNAQSLIKEGQATISTAICTRDDIMTYLIHMGLESKMAFSIMESVRRGRGLIQEWEEEMLRCRVPEWYIRSCKKIKYMFPKAHAAAYVMMAYRIAYCKIRYPLAYYSAFFSIRADAFSYEKMCRGRERLEAYIAEMYTKKRDGEQSAKEQESLKDMRIVQEMYARGFSFVPIDIYRAKADRFQIMGDKLMPSLISIDGLGGKAAYALEKAAKEGAFISKDDLRTRGKVSKTVVETMTRLGLLEGLAESDQLSLFE